MNRPMDTVRSPLEGPAPSGVAWSALLRQGWHVGGHGLRTDPVSGSPHVRAATERSAPTGVAWSPPRP